MQKKKNDNKKAKKANEANFPPAPPWIGTMSLEEFCERIKTMPDEEVAAKLGDPDFAGALRVGRMVEDLVRRGAAARGATEKEIEGLVFVLAGVACHAPMIAKTPYAKGEIGEAQRRVVDGYRDVALRLAILHELQVREVTRNQARET